MGNSGYELVENNITIRFEPEIYAFRTNTIPAYLKVGDTFRGYERRISEWKKVLEETLKKEISITEKFNKSAKVNNDLYFRDYAVHRFFESHSIKSIEETEPELLNYYSREFFKDAKIEDVESAIEAIIKDAEDNNPETPYTFYKVADKKSSEFHYNNDKIWKLRPNQDEVVENYIANKDNYDEFLMYAVMRFGKSFTAMQCALQTDCDKVLIVSAKADVVSEWKRTIEMPECFKDYQFICDSDLVRGDSIDHLRDGKNRIAVFLTLQNLSGKATDGKNIKKKLEPIFATEFDLVIVDETHYGAWSKVYGSPLALEEDGEFLNDEKKKIKNLDEKLENKIHCKKKLHLSGTPYNLLFDEQFTGENIIATCQFPDILKAKEDWDEEHWQDIEEGKDNPETKAPYQEFDNPYFGFPNMLRFAFNLPEETRDLLAKSKKSGEKWTLNDLFETTHNEDSDEYKFNHEEAVLQLLKIIDGKENHKEVLSFLDIPKIRDNDVCKHIVMALPYKSCCDAMEQLFANHKDDFKNLKNYEVLNITGHTLKSELDTVEKVKKRISDYEAEGKKTITLTVHKMLTGVTVKEWDTMIMLRNTKSAQEYDQSAFRIMNPYVIELEGADGEVIKKDMKPQTILVDFDPLRMFEIQGLSAQVVNAVKKGETGLKKSIENDLKFFPIIAFNGEELTKVEPANIVRIITQYNSDKSIMDEASRVQLDESLLENDEIRAFVEAQSKASLTNSLMLDAHTGREGGFNASGLGSQPAEKGKKDGDSGNSQPATPNEKPDKKELKILQKKYQMCIANLAFYAFLSDSDIESMKDILASINNENICPETLKRNRRIFSNLNISEDFIQNHIDNCPRHVSIAINDTIHKANMLSQDSELDSVDRAKNALNRFSRISDSEIVTPQNDCEKMIDYLLDEAELIETVNNGGRILDVAGKTGEFAFALYNKLDGKVDEENLKKALYTIPTSSVTYEFVRRTYELLGFNVENIADKFTSYDLIKLKKKITKGKKAGQESKDLDAERIRNILTQNKKFKDITLEDDSEGDVKMKFDFAIGNPPYQDNTLGDNDKYAPPVYHKFIDAAINVASKVELVHPARFLFNAGSTPKEWNQKMLNNEHFRVLQYESDARKLFQNTSITGGIAVTYFDADNYYKPIKFFSSYPELNAIREKVTTSNGFNPFSSIVSGRTPYLFTDILHSDCPFVKERLSDGHLYDIPSEAFSRIPEIFVENPAEETNYYRVLGRINGKRDYRWILKKYVRERVEGLSIGKWKVLLPKANGASGMLGDDPARLISKPVVGKPQDVSTDTFLFVGSFLVEAEAKAALDYMNSKFARILLGALKVTQNNSKETWAFVPLQDFTENSDIDWSKPVSEIDQQLYIKYNLSDAEITFIEKHVKEME